MGAAVLRAFLPATVAAVALLAWPADGALAQGAGAPPSTGGAPSTPDAARPEAREQQARAIALYEEAARRYDRGDFGGAAELLREAWSLYRNPTLLYNLARAIEGAGDLGGAIEAYEEYLRVAPQAADGRMVRARVDALRRMHAEREALVSARMRAVQQRDALAARIEREEPASRGPWPWIVAGVGVAGVGTGAALWALALDRKRASELEPEQRASLRLFTRAETFGTWGTVALVGGGVLTLTGLGWWLYGQLFQPHVAGFRSLSVSLAPTGARAEVRF